MQAAAGADAGNRRRLEHEDEGSDAVAHLLAQIRQDVVLGQSLVLTLLERLQRDEDDARIGRVGEGRAVEADECDRRFDARARSRISPALRTTSSVRLSVEPGGSWKTAMK